MITPIYLDLPCYCSDRRYGHHWPSRDSLASCDPRLPFVSSRFFMIYLLITKLLREMSQSGMWFYLFLQWMSTDFLNLHDAPGALHHTLCQYVLCRRPKAWPPFRSEELLLVHFALFVCPPLIFMSYCRFSLYYPGMYYIFCCFESVTVGLAYIDITALS